MKRNRALRNAAVISVLLMTAAVVVTWISIVRGKAQRRVERETATAHIIELVEPGASHAAVRQRLEEAGYSLWPQLYDYSTGKNGPSRYMIVNFSADGGLASSYLEYLGQKITGADEEPGGVIVIIDDDGNAVGVARALGGDILTRTGSDTPRRHD